LLVDPWNAFGTAEVFARIGKLAATFETAAAAQDGDQS
jgi:hypothetical protein